MYKNNYIKKKKSIPSVLHCKCISKSGISKLYKKKNCLNVTWLSCADFVSRIVDFNDYSLKDYSLKFYLNWKSLKPAATTLNY